MLTRFYSSFYDDVVFVCCLGFARLARIKTRPDVDESLAMTAQERINQRDFLHGAFTDARL